MEPSLVYTALSTAMADMEMLEGHQPESQAETTMKKVNVKEAVVNDFDNDDEVMIDSKSSTPVLPDDSDLGESGGDESDVELLEIQTYDEDISKSLSKAKPVKKQSKTAKALALKQRRAAAKAAREEKAAKEARLAEEKKERRRKMLNFDEQEILEIDSDDDSDEEEQQEKTELKQEDISDAAKEDDYAEEIGGASMMPADKYCPIPIIIQTDNYPYLLSPVAPHKHAELLKEYDDNIVTLLDEALMPVYSLSQVLDKIKETFKDLENPFDEENEVVVKFKEFGISIPETCIHAQEVLLCEIYEAFNSLCKMKGPDAPKHLCLELSEQKSFVTKLEEIRKLAESDDELLVDMQDTEAHTAEGKSAEDDVNDLAGAEAQGTALEDAVVEETQEIDTQVTETVTLAVHETSTTKDQKNESKSLETEEKGDLQESIVGKSDETENISQHHEEKEEKEKKEKEKEKEKENTGQQVDNEEEEELLEETTEITAFTDGKPHQETPMTLTPVTISENVDTVETAETEITVAVTEMDSTSVDITKESSLPSEELNQLHDDESEGSHAEEFADALDSTKRPFDEIQAEEASSEAPDSKRVK